MYNKNHVRSCEYLSRSCDYLRRSYDYLNRSCDHQTVLPSEHVFIRLPCEQLVGYGSQEDVPGTVANFVPSVGEKLTTDGHSEVLETVSPTASQLLVVCEWQNIDQNHDSLVMKTT